VTQNSQPGERPGWPFGRFFVGANLPWIDYGCDFGTSAWFPDGGLGARPDALNSYVAALDRLAGDRVRIVRLFLLCDLRSGVRFDSDGAPCGLDDVFFRDVDLAMDTAAERGLGLLPVLFDFHLCRAPEVVSGVQLGGRSRLVSDPRLRDRLLSQVVRPVAARYAHHPAVVAWDLFNEPEWCTWSLSTADASHAVEFASMRDCLGQMVACLHADAAQPVTVGMAGIEHLDLVRGLGLDFYQVHWYERFGWFALADAVTRFDLDRPVVLGEFPGRCANTTPFEIVSTARRAGYAGALVWSVLAADDVSEYATGLAISD